MDFYDAANILLCILLDQRNDLFDVRCGDFPFVKLTADSLFVQHDNVRGFLGHYRDVIASTTNCHHASFSEM